MPLGTREQINIDLARITGWGDYAGSMVERANSAYLSELVPDSIVTVTRDFGWTELALAHTVHSADLEAILEAIREARSYPDATGDFSDSFVHTETIRWYHEYGISDIVFALKARVNWSGNTLLADEDHVIQVAMSSELEQYWETATDFHAGHTDEALDIIIDTLLDEYATAQTEALHAGLDALVQA